MRLRLTAFLFLFAAIAAFSQSPDEWYVGKPIKDIRFEGLRNVKSDELDGIVQPFLGRLFDDSLFMDLQGRLYALEYFDAIAPSAVPADPARSAVILKFSVTEKPVVARIRFEGNKGLRQNELLDVVTIKSGDVVNSMKLKLDEQAVRDKYLEKGYPNAVVKAETRAQDDSSQSVVFVIDEGEQTAIESLGFEGNETVSERTLRGLLSLKPKSLLNAGAYQESKLQADKDAIVGYYKERGYIDAAVFDVAKESRKDADGRNMLSITFRIKEGRQYTFGGITFEGNKIFSSERLGALVSQKKDQTLNFKRLEADFQRIADLYYENGYIFNTINRREKRDENAAVVSYTVSIVERSRAYVENIIVRGNKKTKDSVILREIPLEPGEIFSKAKVMDGLRSLYNLQYFSAITPETPQGSAENLMDLIFNVEEQPTADIQFGVTFSGSTDPEAFPMSALIKWSDRNFLGNGQTFSISLTASPETQELSFQFTERWLFGSPLSGTFDFTIGHYQKNAATDNNAIFVGDEDYAYPDPYTSYQEYYDNDKSVPSAYLMTYDKWSYSVGFSSGYRFRTPVGLLSLGGALRAGLFRNEYDDTLYRPFDPTLRSGNNQWLSTQSITGSVSLDNRDLSYDASKGTYFSQRASLVGLFPFEREHYLRSDTKGEAYLTLWDFMLKAFRVKAVLAGYSGISAILPQFYGNEPEILYSNKLSIDGMFVGRGWYSESTNYGLAMWNNWLEIRSPLAPGVLSLDWFCDAVAVKDTPQELFSNLTLEDFRFSLGAGLRFAIPQFPFRFSLAKRFKVVDDKIQWMTGSLWNTGEDGSGLDFVLSFVISTN